MKTKTRTNPLIGIAAALAMLALASMACSFNHVRLNMVSPVVEVSLYEHDLNDMAPNSELHTGHHCNLLDDVTRIEMHDGFLRFLGTKDQPGGHEVEGSVDVSMSAENNILKVQIIAVDIPGTDINDPCIIADNIELEEELSHLLIDPDGEVEFQEVVVEEGVLRMKVQVHIHD